MQRQYNGATFYACAMKGSAACGKKSTKILKIIYWRCVSLALLYKRRVGTLHMWGQCTRGDSAHAGTVHSWGHCTRGTVHMWGQCARGDKEGSATMENISKREAIRAKRSASLIVIELAYSLGCT